MLVVEKEVYLWEPRLEVEWKRHHRMKSRILLRKPRMMDVKLLHLDFVR